MGTGHGWVCLRKRTQRNQMWQQKHVPKRKGGGLSMGSRLHHLMLTEIVTLRHDKLHGCRLFMNEIILGKCCLYGWAWNTCSDTVHHHNSRVFSRLLDDGAIVLTNHWTFDDCTRRPCLFDTLITYVSSLH